MKKTSKTTVSDLFSKVARKGFAFVMAASMFLTIGAWQVPAQKDVASDPKNAERLVGVAVGVMGMATGPGAPAALAAAKIMKDMMSALGFFKSSDPVGEAIASINQRIDAANARMDRIEGEIQALNNRVFEGANLARIRLLGLQRDAVEKVVADLKVPADQATKERNIIAARQIADTLLRDKDLWQYSDLTIKDQLMPTFNGTTGLNEFTVTVPKGTMLPPDFKTIPTLEVYASALAAWMAAIERAGNPGQVNALYGQDLQKHIDYLSVGSNFDETGKKGNSLPEQLRQQIQGFYVPTTKYPDAGLMCNFSEYVEDGFAREIKFIKTYEYRVVAANSLCSIPAGLTKQATMAEGDFERAYGLEVIEELAKGLTRLKRNGTLREQFIGTFDTNFKADEFNLLYTVSQDGTMTWHRHVIRYAGGKRVHSFNPPKVVGSGWADGVRDVMSASLKGIYSLRNDGDLQWFWHEGFSDGSSNFLGGSNYVTTKNMQGFYQVIAQDEGVMYGRLHPNDPGILWGITANYNNRGMPKTSFAMRLTAQTINFANFKKIFAGGKGVLYGISHDGKLYWMRHLRYLSPVPAEYQTMQGIPFKQAEFQQWLTQWAGPVEIMSGVGDATHAFSPGEGHLYFVLNDGSLAYTRHAAWNTTTGRISNQFLPTIDKPVPIAGGWGSYKFAFARITTSDAGSGVRGLDIIVN